jgi:hypothetical protein
LAIASSIAVTLAIEPAEEERIPARGKNRVDLRQRGIDGRTEVFRPETLGLHREVKPQHQGEYG